jgi:hypothetical protein
MTSGDVSLIPVLADSRQDGGPGVPRQDFVKGGNVIPRTIEIVSRVFMRANVVSLGFVPVLLAVMLSSCAPAGAQNPPESVGWKGANNVIAERMWGSGTTRNYTATEQDVVDAINAGIRWSRFVVYTPSSDPAIPGTQPLSDLDRLVNMQAAHGMNMMMNIQQLSDTYDPNNTTARTNYKNWVTSIVNRYKTKIHYYEIHNEENGNGPGFWMVGVDAVPGRGDCQRNAFNTAIYDAGVRTYFAFLQDSYTAIKAADSTAKVIIGGLSEWTEECFIDRITAEGAYQWMDYMALHPYADTPDGSILRLQALKSRMATWPVPYRNMGIWITEVGWQSTDPHFNVYADPTTKANNLVQEMNLLHSNGITAPIFWYDLHEEDSSVMFGLTQRDPANPSVDNYQPAYYSFQGMPDAALGGGTLLSQGRPAAASSVEGPGLEALYAFDGDIYNTRWSSLSSDPQWLRVDLGATKTIREIKLYWESAYAKAYRIEVSNSTSGPWTTLYSTTNGPGGNEDLIVSGSGRYVRMYGTVRWTPWGYSLYEMQVYGN